MSAMDASHETLIQELLSLELTSEPGDEIQQVIQFLESNVTRGTVDVDRRGEYPDIYYENETGRYRLHQVSSMVSEIAAIILYLKYVVRPGHLFIIEEPESHIDAGNQPLLARAIAMLVNAGVKVLITTHSDFFVNQISNLLMLSRLSADQQVAQGYTADEILEPDDVGAYLFRPTEDGTIVDPLEVTSDDGIPIDTFAAVHAELYDEAISIEHTP